MKALVAVIAGAALMVAPIMAQAHGGGGGSGGGGHFGGGGFGGHSFGGHGFGGRGVGDRGFGGRGDHGFGDRGDHGFGDRGGRGFRDRGFGDDFFFDADFGFGFYDDPWLFDDPGFYGYGPADYQPGYGGPVYDVPASANQGEASANDRRAPQAAKPTACGDWHWDDATHQYQWLSAAC